MKKIELGTYNKLTVVKKALREGFGEEFGVYLDGGKAGDILMPQKYVPEGLEIGDEVEVLVYLDQDERPIATTEHPLATVNLSLIHISEPTRPCGTSRMPSSA